MGKQSIQTKLTAVLIAVSLIGMTAVFVLNYLVMRGAILDELLEKTHNMVAFEAQKIDGWFDRQITFVDSVGTSLAAADDHDKALAILTAQTSKYSYYYNIYMGLSDDKAIFVGDSPDYSTWKATQRGWYKSAMAGGGKSVITPPYVDANAGGTVITVAKDVGAFSGLNAVFAVDMDISTIVSVVNGIETYGGYAFLVNQDGYIVAHPDAQFNPQGEDYVKMSDVPVYSQMFPANQQEYHMADYDGVSRYIFPHTVESSGWILYVAIPQTAVLKAINPDAVTIIISVLFLIAAAFVVSWIVSRMVVRPLIEVVNAGSKLADGDLNIELRADKDDEIGQLIGQFATIVENTQKQADVLEAISHEDFSISIAPRSSHDTMNIAIQKMVNTISGVLLEIKGSAMQVSGGAQQISNGAQQLAQGATEQAATVEQLAATISDVSEKTKANAHTSNDARELSESIKIKAEQGSDQMEQMMQAVKDINESSQSIGKVIKIIDDIAFQTNILALNAAVEAARAGQHGKGFAVVADEVRSLAAKSADAAKNTNELIETSIKTAEMGASISRGTSESLKQIVEGIIRNSELIADISQSSDEQSTAIAQISEAISQVSQIIYQNSATAEESAAASEEMFGQSTVLQNLISQFKINDDAEKFSARSTSPRTPDTTVHTPRPAATGFSTHSDNKY